MSPRGGDFVLSDDLRSFEKRAALSAVAVLFLGVGMILLSVALFLVLEALRGAVFAATVLGLGSLGLGLIAAVLARHSTPAAAAPDPKSPDLPSLSDAFLTGVEAGHSLRRMDGRP